MLAALMRLQPAYAAIVAKDGYLGMSGFLVNSYMVVGCSMWLQVTIHG